MLRLVVALLGLFFALQGVAWILVPSIAAGSLGMPLLDGIGRSTQIGDFSAFFLVAGASMLLGSRPGRARSLYFPAALLGGAAAMRTLAWFLQGAHFATVFIAVEVSACVILCIAARRLDATP